MSQQSDFNEFYTVLDARLSAETGNGLHVTLKATEIVVNGTPYPQQTIPDATNAWLKREGNVPSVFYSLNTIVREYGCEVQLTRSLSGDRACVEVHNQSERRSIQLKSSEAEPVSIQAPLHCMELALPQLEELLKERGRQ